MQNLHRSVGNQALQRVLGSGSRPFGSRGTGHGPDPAVEGTSAEAAPVASEPRRAGDAAASETTTASEGAGTLRWRHEKRHRWDALWFFCGERPSGFSTTATLRAEGYSDPDAVEWFVRQGADKVYAPDGFRGKTLTLHSSAGSVSPGDVHIEVQERLADGTVSSSLDYLTVRKPHRLIQESTTDHASCPPWDPSPASCVSFWSEIRYRVVDNVGGTVVGATVNERFPGPAVDDQPNYWRGATVTAGGSWPNTNGTFVDNLYKCCGVPSPVTSSSASWGDKVYHEPQQFYVGSTVSGRGCRVQSHTLQFYRGFADHEGIRSPAP